MGQLEANVCLCSTLYVYLCVGIVYVWMHLRSLVGIIFDRQMDIMQTCDASVLAQKRARSYIFVSERKSLMSPVR